MRPVFITKFLPRYTGESKWKKAGYITLYSFCVLILFVAGISLYFAKDLPTPGKINRRLIIESTKIFDRTGEHLLYEIHGEEKRTLIPAEEIPDTVKYTTIVLEDQDFYSHHGIKLSSIIRAAIKDVLHKNVTQGGSTITQQFIKNSVLSSERTMTRKIKEVILALELEQKFSKDEILGMYLNEIPYGSNAYGIEAAAQTYFGKHARELSLDEAALLAALPQAPSYYSPYGSHLDALKSRQALALQRLADSGYITQTQADETKKVDVLSKITSYSEPISAPHFVMYVKEYLEKNYGQQVVEQGGLKVYTTLDWDKQQIAERLVKEGADKNLKSWNAANAALVALDPKTGQILSMVGSKDYFDKSVDGQVNVAIRDRQPGSSFKPYVYLTAFSKGYTPETTIFDTKTNFSTDTGKDYTPQNYDGKFRGPLQLKNTLAMSLNIPAVKVLYLAGVKDSIMTAKSMGITTLNKPNDYGLSLVLGGGEVKLLDHTNAFGTLATGGIYHTKTPILRIEDNGGKTLEEFKQNDGQRVVEEKYVAMIDYILSTNDLRSPIFGSNTPLRFDSRPVAAKTGTTNEFRDGWTVGYTPSLVVGVWAGNNDNTAMKAGADGVNVAAPIWRGFLDQVLGNYAIEQFPKYEKEDTGKDVLDGKLKIKNEVKVCKVRDNQYCLADGDHCPGDDDPKKKDVVEAHTILTYVNKDDPRGPVPDKPESDPQYRNWEKGIQNWHSDDKKDTVYLLSGDQCKGGGSSNNPQISVSVSQSGNKLTIISDNDAPKGVDKVSFYVNGSKITTLKSKPYQVNYNMPDALNGTTVVVEVELTDDDGDKAKDSRNITVSW